MIAKTHWNRFQWKITSLPIGPKLENPFSIRLATPEEKEIATQVALLSLKMNTEWHDATTLASQAIHEAKKHAFADNDAPACLVITHGQRIIGVSMLDLRPEAQYHLLCGPWILMEYRNRGLGSALLYASLEELARRGLTEASGITRNKSIAARFVYPKFHGHMSASEPPEFSLE